LKKEKVYNPQRVKTITPFCCRLHFSAVAGLPICGREIWQNSVHFDRTKIAVFAELTSYEAGIFKFRL